MASLGQQVTNLEAHNLHLEDKVSELEREVEDLRYDLHHMDVSDDNWPPETREWSHFLYVLEHIADNTGVYGRVDLIRAAQDAHIIQGVRP